MAAPQYYALQSCDSFREQRVSIPPLAASRWQVPAACLMPSTPDSFHAPRWGRWNLGRCNRAPLPLLLARLRPLLSPRCGYRTGVQDTPGLPRSKLPRLRSRCPQLKPDYRCFHSPAPSSPLRALPPSLYKFSDFLPCAIFPAALPRGSLESIVVPTAVPASSTSRSRWTLPRRAWPPFPVLPAIPPW